MLNTITRSLVYRKVDISTHRAYGVWRQWTNKQKMNIIYFNEETVGCNESL